MVFANRQDAGRQLAIQLREFANRNDLLVLGIPRGGVPVASQVASSLGAPLDIFLSRKLGVPGQEELAFGAIAAGDGQFLDQSMIRAIGLSGSEVERIIQSAKEILSQSAALYRGNKPPLQVEGKLVILVDDGVATGASVYAAIHALKEMKSAMVVLAVPVMPASTYQLLKNEVNLLVCLHKPKVFNAVSQFYRDFTQVDDRTVITLLEEGKKASSNPLPQQNRNVTVKEVLIRLKNVSLPGRLLIPEDAVGIVLFAHGSGSSRHSPRNLYVAHVLQSHGLATLLFDLLTTDEEQADQQTSQYRFNIKLLSERLTEVTHWVRQLPRVGDLSIGYFGASTGAAAALLSAAKLPGEVASVVSRGGRPDLAGEYLPDVQASVMLIVGGRDQDVLTLNREALRRLTCHDKQLVIIPGATHLFQERGALEQVARDTATWFDRTLQPARAALSMAIAN